MELPVIEQRAISFVSTLNGVHTFEVARQRVPDESPIPKMSKNVVNSDRVRVHGHGILHSVRREKPSS